MGFPESDEFLRDIGSSDTDLAELCHRIQLSRGAGARERVDLHHRAGTNSDDGFLIDWEPTPTQILRCRRYDMIDLNHVSSVSQRVARGTTTRLTGRCTRQDERDSQADDGPPAIRTWSGPGRVQPAVGRASTHG